ncbi:helix-turn-helix domain-containing protein [uncultured Pontibacter sp.]|uniref:helix-turn-helix domain-containing protein n=1 Tax=uncultured Pontibacter sp. TaxID=453356 RepID=UPI002639ADF0|nr:helix-turn-helix domain-containing protein [uncultured Pontibacter sp.]
MENPFEYIENRLSSIESLLLYLKDKTFSKPAEEADRCSLPHALVFLNGQGYPISKSKLYKMTAADEVPHKRFGNRLVFSRKALLEWVESQTTDRGRGAARQDVCLKLAASARKKGGRNNG